MLKQGGCHEIEASAGDTEGPHRKHAHTPQKFSGWAGGGGGVMPVATIDLKG